MKTSIAIKSKSVPKKMAPKAKNLAKSLQLRTTAKNGAKIKK
jgi:hypothetical protein